MTALSQELGGYVSPNSSLGQFYSWLPELFDRSLKGTTLGRCSRAELPSLAHR